MSAEGIKCLVLCLWPDCSKSVRTPAGAMGGFPKLANLELMAAPPSKAVAVDMFLITCLKSDIGPEAVISGRMFAALADGRNSQCAPSI